MALLDQEERRVAGAGTPPVHRPPNEQLKKQRLSEPRLH